MPTLEHFQQKFDRINRLENKRKKYKTFFVKFFDYGSDFFVEEPRRIRVK